VGEDKGRSGKEKDVTERKVRKKRGGHTWGKKGRPPPCGRTMNEPGCDTDV